MRSSHRVDGVAVSIGAFQALDPGSTPGRRIETFIDFDNTSIFGQKFPKITFEPKVLQKVKCSYFRSFLPDTFQENPSEIK